MKSVIFLLLVLVSNSVFALECRYSKQDGDAEIRENNIEHATGIYFGRIIQAEYMKNKDSKDTVSFQFQVIETIKGSLGGVMYLTSYLSNGALGTEVGQTYIIVMADSNKVNFCNMVFPIGPGFGSLERLHEWALRIDIPYAPRVKKLLEQYGKLP